jgi:hypothetical protein
MTSTAMQEVTEADLRQRLLDVLAETMFASAKVADSIAMDRAAGASVPDKCQEARLLLIGIYQAAVLRLEDAALPSTTENALPAAPPPRWH